jgi:glycosyltransferase involved in cell wall biosynthesis
MPESNKKIAIVIPSLEGGGAERVALFVAERLAEAGYVVDLVYARDKGVLRDNPVARSLGVCLHARNEMLCLPELVQYLRSKRPHLVLALVHSAKIMAGLACALVPGTCLAISIHNNLLSPRADRFWVRRFFGFAPERWLYRHVVAAHSVSRELAEQVESCFAIPAEKSFTIYNPSNESPYPDDVAPEHRALFERPVVLNAGRLVAQKDHAALIRAFATSGLAGRTRLVILGEGPLRAELAAHVVELGLEESVALPGHVPDTRPYLARASGYALSSRFEGLPLALLEALRAGLPIVSYACPCGPQELLDGGRLGTLVPPGDEDAFARALREMMDGGGVRPAASAIAEHLALFAPATIGAQYCDLVEHCLAQSAAR